MKKISKLSLTLAAAFALFGCETNPSDDDILYSMSSNSSSPRSSVSYDVDDDSSSSASDSLSSATDPENLSSEEENISSSSEAGEEVCEGANKPVDISIDEFGFADIADVYSSVRCNEKVVFVVRHAERDLNDVSKEAPITEEGIQDAISVGLKLFGEGDFQFSHSDFVRTEQTCKYIAQGRGQTNYTHETVAFVTGNWFVKDTTKYNGFLDTTTTKLNVKTLVADWAFTGNYGEAFYDLKERSEEVISTFLAPNYEKMPKFHLVCTHDDFVVPMAVYLTDKKVALKFHDKDAGKEKNWINYIAGVAIVLNDKNERRVYAVKGLEDGIY